MRLGSMIAIGFAFLMIGIGIVHCMIAHVIASVFPRFIASYTSPLWPTHELKNKVPGGQYLSHGVV